MQIFHILFWLIHKIEDGKISLKNGRLLSPSVIQSVQKIALQKISWTIIREDRNMDFEVYSDRRKFNWMPGHISNSGQIMSSYDREQLGFKLIHIHISNKISKKLWRFFELETLRILWQFYHQKYFSTYPILQSAWILQKLRIFFSNQNPIPLSDTHGK